MQQGGGSMSTLPASVDVLVVGLGPAGATMANLLGRYGVRTLVIDRAADIFTAPRAIALDNEALRVLQLAGVQEHDFEKIAIPHVQMYCPVFGRYSRANTAGQLDGHPKLVTFYQPELEAVLRARLANSEHVQVATQTELIDFTQDASGVQARLRHADGSEGVVQARYMVGVDGASSLVRGKLGLAFTGKTFQQDWLIVDAKNVAKPIDHVEFICDPHRPTPHMVAPGGRQRWEFMLRPGETREQMEQPDAVRRLLAPWAQLQDIEIERIAVYRFHARLARTFQKGRVFLAGDAAHLTPPFVGQGLVAGLRDVANLSWKLAWVCHGRASPALLESYTAERRPHAKAMIDLALLMGRLVMPTNKLAAIAIHGFVRLMQYVKLARRLIEDLQIKPKPEFRVGVFAPRCSGSPLLRGGLMVQSWVRRGQEAPVLSDEALGPHLTLLGFGVDPLTQLDPELRRRWSLAGGRSVQFTHRGQALNLGQATEVWEDLTQALVPGLAPVGWLAVVRPDRTILHDGPATDVNRLVRESLALLGAAETAGTQGHALPQQSKWHVV